LITSIITFATERRCRDASHREIRQTAHALRDFPQMGHKGLLPNTREMNVKGLPYVIVYRFERVDNEDFVVVLSVFHGAQDREHSVD
jgi:plasmid stabilization system protein ParE